MAKRNSKEAKIRVGLLSITARSQDLLFQTMDADELCAIAAKQCYNQIDARDIQVSSRSVASLLSHCIASGHLSILEHPSATFSVSGFSRSFLAQITRHRHLSFSVQSQHYIDHASFNYCIPTSIRQNTAFKEGFENMMASLQKYYNTLVEHGVPHHDARQVLPNAVEAKMVVTGNFRAWFEFLQKRLCKRNTEEIVEFSKLVLEELVLAYPSIFMHCGAPCDFGECREEQKC